MTEWKPEVGDKVWIVPLTDEETNEIMGYVIKPRSNTAAKESN